MSGDPFPPRCEFCRLPVSLTGPHAGLCYARDGHRRRVFCWSGCVRWYLGSADARGLDSLTRAGLEALAQSIDRATIVPLVSSSTPPEIRA